MAGRDKNVVRRLRAPLGRTCDGVTGHSATASGNWRDWKMAADGDDEIQSSKRRRREAGLGCGARELRAADLWRGGNEATRAARGGMAFAGEREIAFARRNDFAILARSFFFELYSADYVVDKCVKSALRGKS